MKFRTEHKNRAVNILVIIFGLIYLSLCFNDNVWTDEAFTMNVIEQNFADILKTTANDVHPPLYYFLAKIATLLVPTYTYRLFVQKIVVLIPMLLTMASGGKWLEKKYGSVSAIIFVLVLGCMPCTLEYAIQVRMYSWALFFVTMCGMKAYESYENDKLKDWILFAVSGIAAAYLHNFSFVSAIIISGLLFLFIAIKKRKLLLHWLFCIIFMTIAYLPWFLVLIEQIRKVDEDYWIPPITVETIWSYVDWAFGNNIRFSAPIFLGIILSGGILNLISIFVHKRKEDILAQICLLVPFLTTAGGVIVSIIKTPIYFNRYVFPALGILCISSAISFRNISKKKVVILCLVFSLYFIQEYREVFAEEYLSTNVEEVKEIISTQMEETDIVVFNSWSYYNIYRYYFNQYKIFHLDEVKLDRKYNNIWFLHTNDNGEFEKSVLDRYGFVIEYVGNFVFESNEGDLYKLERVNGE